jgi:F0F1-type ATP synthase assembly protein I
MSLGRTAGLTIALLMVLVGGVWIGQGFGYIEGSFMTDQDEWAIIGSLTAGLGLALAIVVMQRGKGS